MQIALNVSLRSTCLKHQVGCVITVDERIRATGYNGAVRGTPHCVTCVQSSEGQCMNGIHAEQNAVAYADTSLEGGVAYVTLKPCLSCTKLLVAAGVRRIVYDQPTAQCDSDAFCKIAGVTLYEV